MTATPTRQRSDAHRRIITMSGARSIRRGTITNSKLSTVLSASRNLAPLGLCVMFTETRGFVLLAPGCRISPRWGCLAREQTKLDAEKNDRWTESPPDTRHPVGSAHPADSRMVGQARAK